MKYKIVFVCLVGIVFNYNLFCSIDDESSDLNKNSTLTESEDPYLVYNPEKFGIDENYIKRITRIKNLKTYNDEIDIHNITYNTNVSLRFPFTFIPFGGVNLGFNNTSHYGFRGFDIGFLYKMETLLRGTASFTTLNSFTSTGSFITFTQFDIYPDFSKDKKIKIYNNASIYTTAPQFSFLKDFHASSGGYIGRLFKRLKIDQTNYNKTGFSYGAGIEVVLPFKDIVSDTSIAVDYNFTDTILTDPYRIIYPADEKNIQKSELYINIMETLTFSMQKQDKALLLGEIVRVYGMASFPLLKDGFDRTPELNLKISNVYTKKIYKDFALKTRILGGLNFNSRENLSGDGMVRGLNKGDFTGFTYLLANIDLLLPMVNININSAADVVFRQKVNFIMYLALFIDGGIALNNDTLSINNCEFEYTNNYLKEYRLYFPDSDNYFNYSFTAGGGLRIYPYFLHFMVRLDIGINLLDTIIYKNAPHVELTISLNDVF
ncbi:MAG: hypothetical protein A2015_08125 [Spirochaetes bacterium GWF1_31_7]|nr:MAG: hypothetical protein A2Y30_02215 [Spirochaetes bacterium GWE1_32_154]OHD47007.1 MAG: hypothetical protein A2015_08125 [Spirochaetes bacterium GWF1_31_7]OHD49785.1 MAG: hypothetical protein A2Y29_06325 [Spirochaetes bacterium GWE2_31_10]HBD95483.1 hypothetical protein [Spirochaetia bacterium]HBI37005.1 hypothetical protein [Spirochaetia bacterium]